ncbi:MAG TPA: hypothetical protein VL598_16610 [Trinickia sp.]|jgi:hypothetical protein|uniref:hypothetical protein n=1 Tax=Trinickia sp. TaxID=2571163 RepID=UPI002C43290D|nr:hypothetical protein [Trinickia sp.]HTI19272.1 hypothetical protein [Trinickia sp.]
MTPDEVLTVFERANVKEHSFDLDEIVAGFAGWLAEKWDGLSKDEISLLTSVGATLWREGDAWRKT